VRVMDRWERPCVLWSGGSDRECYGAAASTVRVMERRQRPYVLPNGATNRAHYGMAVGDLQQRLRVIFHRIASHHACYLAAPAPVRVIDRRQRPCVLCSGGSDEAC
jgi:hypothetical protein